MKIVIVGDGKVGYTLTKQLSQEGHDVVVIDNDQKVLQQSMETLDVFVVQGNGATLAVQQEAEVGQSDLLIAATSGDEINLLCCVLAKKLGCRHTIARVRNPEYIQQLSLLREDLGLSMTINPERTAAHEIFRLLQFPSFLKRDTFCRGRVELVELKIKEGSPLAGVQLKEFHKVTGVNVLVCAVDRASAVTIPVGDFRLEEGDKITVTAANTDLAKLMSRLGLSSQKIRDVMIIGGGRIAAYLAKILLNTGVRVKIIEQNMEKCRALSEALPNAIIICGDGTSQELLCAEGITECDAVIPLTNMDEENIIISLYADHMGVSKSITKINRTEYEAIFRDRGLGSVISPKLLTANDIVGYVRAMKQSTASAMLSLYRLCDGQVEAMEFQALDGTHHLGVPLKTVNLRPNVLIACINRGSEVIIPRGDDCILAGDNVVIVTTAAQPISTLNDIFAPEVAE